MKIEVKGERTGKFGKNYIFYLFDISFVLTAHFKIFFFFVFVVNITNIADV